MDNGIPLPPLAAIFGQSFGWSDLAVVGLLILLEGVLSIDNALVLGLLAKRLPKRQRAKALTYGIVGAFIFRAIAVATASLLLQWTFVKFLGGAYLVYIAVKHLFFEAQEKEDDKIVLDASGQPELVDAETGGELSAEHRELEIKERVPFNSVADIARAADEEAAQAANLQNSLKESPSATPRKDTPAEFWRFWKTVFVIELTDIAFAVDSILAAIALAGGRHEKLWVIITGGIIGMILMRFAATIFIRLLDRFPRFETAAYLLVILIGVKLLVDWGFNSNWNFRPQPWIRDRLGGWQQTFDDLEESRIDLVHKYDDWLKKNWIFPVQHEHEKVPQQPQPGQIVRPPPVPHLLDFHDLRFPECMLFWVLMILCFCVGFIPQRQKDEEPEIPAK